MADIEERARLDWADKIAAEIVRTSLRDTEPVMAEVSVSETIILRVAAALREARQGEVAQIVKWLDRQVEDHERWAAERPRMGNGLLDGIAIEHKMIATRTRQIREGIDRGEHWQSPPGTGKEEGGSK